MAVAGSNIQDQRQLLFVGNRWVNTVYTGYGTIKQRILLQVLQHFQDNIKKTMRGRRVEIPRDHDVYIAIDMSKVVYYNNYYQVREAIKQMCAQPISIYNDPTFKQSIYAEECLLAGYEATAEKKIMMVCIKRAMAQLLLHVDYKNGKAFQYTKFDALTIRKSSTKYMHPLYTMICSYAEKGGFTIGIDELRYRLQVEEKYKGFDNFHRFVLKHVQKELQIMGEYGYNFSLVKEGRTVKKIVFKIFANKKYDPNHVWLRIQRALNEDLPYYVRFTPEQREQFNYLLTGKYDLDQVHDKLQHIHKALVKRKAKNDPAKNPFQYTIKSIQDQFPPG